MPAVLREHFDALVLVLVLVLVSAVLVLGCGDIPRPVLDCEWSLTINESFVRQCVSTALRCCWLPCDITY